MENRKKFMIIFFSCYGALTLLFIILTMTLHVKILGNIAASLIILWIPALTVLLASSMTQAKAGSFYNYFRIKEKDRRDEFVKLASTDNFLESENYKKLDEQKSFLKIRSVSRVKSQDANYRKYKINLVDLSKCYIYMTPRTDENTTHDVNAEWLVDKIEFEEATDVI